ncbi:hypothetical protein NL676_017271 [Syzygium grande]|nr:hypothetical protein NL676_017271 [Syzygium grande]
MASFRLTRSLSVVDPGGGAGPTPETPHHRYRHPERSGTCGPICSWEGGSSFVPKRIVSVAPAASRNPGCVHRSEIGIIVPCACAGNGIGRGGQSLSTTGRDPGSPHRSLRIGKWGAILEGFRFGEVRDGCQELLFPGGVVKAAIADAFDGRSASLGGGFELRPSRRSALSRQWSRQG